MTPERWQQIGELFARALNEPEAERAAWLDASGAPDDVRREVTALLESHASDEGFLESPPGEADDAARQASRDSVLVPGATVGPYRLVRELGRGGMGVVFEAEDTRLQRRVALKAVSADAADVGHQRLRQEARAAAALVHPNIATIYALDDIDGRAYIASEYLEGETLRDVLTRGPLARDETLAIAHALASALETAHARGIVHRDLKPENVLRLPDGRVKVLDFGLARLEGEARRLQSSTRLTLPGLVLGTPGYMAPEQLLGDEVDGRADQFALGVLIAEMASGRNPFEAGSLAATIALVMRADGLPGPLDGALVSADIAALATRCTRHRPADRFATSADVVAAIERCRQGVVDRAPSGADSAARHALPPSGFVGRDPVTGRRPALWWWRFHQAAAAAIYWLMVVPAWLVHRDVPPGLPWFLGCLAATIVAANVRLHLRFSAAVLPAELAAQRAKTRGFVAIADWAVILLGAWAGLSLLETRPEWSVVFVAFAVGAALAVSLIEPATTRAAFTAARHSPT